MRRHIAKHVRETAGGERARHFAAKQPAGMFKLDSGTPSFPTSPHIREAAKKALFTVHRATGGVICTFVQRAGAAALRGSQECVAEMRCEYGRA